MSRTRLVAWLACALVAGALAGCGEKHSRILGPTTDSAAPGALTVGRRTDAASALRLGLIPPTVQITCPVPTPLANHATPPALRILWEGTDPDGIFTDRPVLYRHILLSPSSEFPVSHALANPDSLRRYSVISEWDGWTTVLGDTTSVQFRNLIPNVD